MKRVLINVVILIVGLLLGYYIARHEVTNEFSDRIDNATRSMIMWQEAFDVIRLECIHAPALVELPNGDYMVIRAHAFDAISSTN